MRNRQTILHSGRISCDHPYRISVLARLLNSNEDHSYLHAQYSDTRDLENCLSSTFLQQFAELEGNFQFQHDNGSHSQITVCINHTYSSLRCRKTYNGKYAIPYKMRQQDVFNGTAHFITDQPIEVNL